MREQHTLLELARRFGASLLHGAPHQPGLRVLAFKWVRILLHYRHEHTPYDESKHLKNLERRQSPILSSVANSLSVFTVRLSA